MKKILVIALFSLAPAFFAVAHTGNTNFSGDVAHSGGTDKNGCHRDHKRGGRHCH
ncbi:YHYH domain-containing protein [Endozoicomonas sp. G2_2]|uniref:YHYH domain-containing protein n=1 Tax=Endozoicomonas sp. G2_2 TaxID=2821092 RepID=UPI001ADB2F1D|nr:YHYH domain-containing protein [Endozoicomonas sp. G2_2]MBO9470767.1 YHYH domain-containing protein [Endozoicomonas sp. G2_2]